MNNSHSSIDQQASKTEKTRKMSKVYVKPIENLEGRFYLCQKADGSLFIFRDDKRKLATVTMGTSTLILFKPAEGTEDNFTYYR